MKKFLKYLLIGVGVFIAGYAIIHFDDVVYGVRQLNGQLYIIRNARSVEEVLADTSVNEKYKEKLRLINDIRKFAVDSLGLKNTDNYTTFYDQQNKPVLWVLTACKPLSFTPHQWHFPFLGAVPYKGFFREDLALAEETELRKQVLDVDLGTTGGWSTLGFFKDPVLSNMLKRSDGQLAELIIHELLHATIYVPGSAEFNENLATFIGEEGAVRFLESRFGSNSKQKQDYIYFLEDEERFGYYMLQATDTLEQLYTSFGDETYREKIRQKYLKILEIVQGIDSLDLHFPERYRFTFPRNRLPDNTWFMGFRRYRGRQDIFKNELEAHNGDLKKYVETLLKKND